MAGGMHGRGTCVAGDAWQGVCMAEGVCGRGCVWQGLCVAGVVRGRGVMCGKGGMCGRGTCMPHMPPMDRMTDMCKNITLPQTSFAGGNNRVNL